MKWFYNMKIGMKLIISFVIVAIISGIVGLIGIININKMNDYDDVLYENMTVPLSEVSQISSLFQRARVNARDLILLENPSDIQESYEKVKEFLDEMNTYAESFKKTITQEEEKVAFQDYLNAYQEYKEELDQLLALSLENNDDEALAFVKGENQETSDDLRFAIEKMVELKIKGANNQADSNTATANKSTVTMIAIILLAMLVAITLGIFISNSISKPVQKIGKAADKIADGDLDVYIDIDTKEEIGQLANSFNKMAHNLNDLILNINLAAEQVSAGSTQVSDSSILLSQGATEQAATIEQLTASLEEIASQTRLNADNSNQANSIAEVAQNNAVEGKLKMKEMLNSMEEINQSSNNISKIIKVIDEIAFQTNILALNAAVEAARAGQHGKGFAVVAEEVRNLAARSASAAKETTEMIEDSIKNVKAGTAIAKQTSEALNNIVDGIAKAATLVGEIAVASNEQASGIEQVNQGIMMVSEVVQNNSATSEESAAASEELSSQADLLKQQVSQFKLRKLGQSTISYGNMSSTNGIKMDIVNNRSANKGYNAISDNNSSDISKNKPQKILLSDKEFGKY